MAVTFGPKITPAFVAALLGDNYFSAGNALLRAFQTLVQPNAISVGLTTPPGSPVNGDTYVVGVGATGLWSGHDKTVAYWTTDNPITPSGLWEFYIPKHGWSVTNQVDNLIYVYNGTVWNPSNVVSGGVSIFPRMPFISTVSTVSGGNVSLVFGLPAGSIAAYTGKFRLKLQVGANSVILGNAVIKRTLPNDQSGFVDSTPITWGGVSNPTLPTGTNVSDVINYIADADHDYYIVLYLDPSNTTGTFYGAVANSIYGCCGAVAGNASSASVATLQGDLTNSWYGVVGIVTA